MTPEAEAAHRPPTAIYPKGYDHRPSCSLTHPVAFPCDEAGLSFEPWTRDGTMVYLDAGGDDAHFVGDAETEDDAQRFVDWHNAARLAAPSAPSSGDLDAAWREAEAALPEGWTGPFVGPHIDGDYWANALRTMGGQPGVQPTGTENLIVAQDDAHGPTPAAALHALAARLASQREPGE